jgi:hypothetical protein
MVPHQVCYQLALFVLVWFFVMLHITGAKPAHPTCASQVQAQTFHRAHGI